MTRTEQQQKEYRRAVRLIAGRAAWLALVDLRDPGSRRCFTPDDLAGVDDSWATCAIWLEPHESPYC
jgi:hypothetical protein